MNGRGALVGFLLSLAAPGFALAQNATAVEQVGQGGRGDLAIAQVGSPGARTAAVAEPRVADPRTPMPQLTRDAPSAEPGVQLTRATPSADAPASGSDRSAGRNVQAAALGGEDRCDVQAAEAEDEPACEQVIETRSAEFRAPEPTLLTPEQRLLIAQRELEESRSPADAVRRLGNGEIDDSTAAMAVASVALQRAGQPEEKPKAEAGPSATDAIIAAIVNTIGVQGP